MKGKKLRKKLKKALVKQVELLNKGDAMEPNYKEFTKSYFDSLVKALSTIV